VSGEANPEEAVMSDGDDGAYIIIEREGGGIGSFILGAMVGAGLALLFAPQSGEETQRDIKDRALRLRDAAEERIKEAQKQLEEKIESARLEMNERVDQIKDAVDAGRQAALEARHELERKLDQSKAAYRAGVDAAKEASRQADGSGEEPLAPGA
jgi:gas vesicle protein